jgi:hypothetical protein
MQPTTETVKNPFCAGTETDLSVPTATLQIYNYINEHLNDRKGGDVNRCSSAPRCVRARWYSLNGYAGEPLAPRAIVNFLLGDLTERTLVYFVTKACVGPGKLYSEVIFGAEDGTIEYQGKSLTKYKQITTSFRIGNLTITGHFDGLGKRNSDGKWELIEFKSAADFGFEEFKENGPGDYIKQSHALFECDACKEKNVESVRYFYLKKNTGHLWDGLFHKDPEITARMIAEYKAAAGNDIPERPYALKPETFRGKPTGRTTCQWQCSYCAFTKECWGKFDVEFKGGKPKFYFEEKV